MPGTNLTRDEARTRAALLDVTSYDIQLDLTTGDQTFASTTTITFTSRQPGAATFADLIGATVHEITLNGAALDPASVYADSRIRLENLAAENVLVVRADLPYSHSGEGLHRFVDPADGRVYTYSQFEVPDARRVYTTFEQPDLKSVFTFHVTAPSGWKVISNSPSPEPVPTGSTTDDGEPIARWDFAPTARMSTYITAIIAGEYYEVQDVYEGAHGTIPIGHYCRQSIASSLDRDELVKVTRQGFEFFESTFEVPYPFGKYDQLYVPEYNMGAMENAGCVTLRDEYLPRSKQPRSFYENRANTILHEMAHMWFGDLVTMKWWNDLWLNESFAEWAAYHAAASATEFTEAWTGFTNARKQTGYRQDQLVTTHPIAPEIADLDAIEVNFDMITYAKGASVLKQLVAWVGLEPFLKGLAAYFKEFAYGNTEFSDLLGHLEKASGRELTSWAAEWLQTSQVNTLRPEFTVGEDGRYTAFAVRQSAPAEHPTLRRHRIGIGFYDKDGDALVRRHYLEVDVRDELTEIPEAVGELQPDLLLLNDDDLTYAKIRLDERSLETALTGLSAMPDSLARALVWGAAWDMLRDGELSAHDFVELVLANIGAETDAWGISRIPHYAELAVNAYADPARRIELKERWEAGLRELILAAEPGSDLQLSLARRYSGSGGQLRGGIHGFSVAEQTHADLKALLDGTWEIPGLTVDQDLRWHFVIGLCAAGVYGEAEVAAEEQRDQTITGQEKAAEARAAIPSAEAKAAAFERGWVDPSTPNETQRSIAVSFSRVGQEELVSPYLPKMLEAAKTLWDRIGPQKASVALEYGFPFVLISEEALATIDAALATEEIPYGARRYVLEGRDEIARALAARAKDAAGA